MRSWFLVFGSMVVMCSVGLGACSSDEDGDVDCRGCARGGTGGSGGSGKGGTTGKGGSGGKGGTGGSSAGAGGGEEAGGATGGGGAGEGCPADLLSAEGMPCDQEGLICSDGGNDPCQFGQILRCDFGEWVHFEAFPDPNCGAGGAGGQGGAAAGGAAGSDNNAGAGG